MPSKLRIKMGTVEFEYEGDAVFDAETIKDLLTHLESVACVAQQENQDAAPPAAPDQSGAPEGAPQTPQGASGQHITTIVAKLSAKTLSELIIASAAHLQIAQGKQTYTRQELHDDMKGAVGTYKTGMGTNLSKTLVALVKASKLVQATNSTYSLPADQLASLKNRLA